MESETCTIQLSLEETTGFLFRKLAALEARFIVLCHRAEAAGIDCRDLMGVEVSKLEEVTPLGAATGPLN